MKKLVAAVIILSMCFCFHSYALEYDSNPTDNEYITWCNEHGDFICREWENDELLNVRTYGYIFSENIWKNMKKKSSGPEDGMIYTLYASGNYEILIVTEPLTGNYVAASITDDNYNTYEHYLFGEWKN